MSLALAGQAKWGPAGGRAVAFPSRGQPSRRARAAWYSRDRRATSLGPKPLASGDHSTVPEQGVDGGERLVVERRVELRLRHVRAKRTAHLHGANGTTARAAAEKGKPLTAPEQAELTERVDAVTHWLADYAPDEAKIAVRDELPVGPVAQLSAEERAWLVPME